MALHDYFEPDPPMECPKCGDKLDGWQGYDGHPGNCVWRQGVASPIDQRVADVLRLPSGTLTELRLPTVFAIHCGTCKCGYRFHGARFGQPFQMRCRTVDGIWRTCEVVPPPTRASDLGDGWIQCSECCDVWPQVGNRRLYLCPGCGILTQLSAGRPRD